MPAPLEVPHGVVVWEREAVHCHVARHPVTRRHDADASRKAAAWHGSTGSTGGGHRRRAREPNSCARDNVSRVTTVARRSSRRGQDRQEAPHSRGKARWQAGEARQGPSERPRANKSSCSARGDPSPEGCPRGHKLIMVRPVGSCEAPGQGPRSASPFHVCENTRAGRGTVSCQLGSPAHPSSGAGVGSGIETAANSVP